MQPSLAFCFSLIAANDGIPSSPGRYAVIILAGLVLSFIAGFILFVIAPLRQKERSETAGGLLTHLDIGLRGSGSIGKMRVLF